MMRNLVIIGSGPAGLTAAIYAARAFLNPLLITGREPGGQLTKTTLVENFPGFPEGIMGPELMERMMEQAKKFGAEILGGEVERVDFKKLPFVIQVDGKTINALSVIIATGATPKMLGIEAEKRYMGRGVSTCATCDGFFFRDMDVVVIGGGDTALEEAIFLTRFAREVTVIHRRDKLRAGKILQDRAFKNRKIKFLWNSVVEDILGDDEGKVRGVVVRNKKENMEFVKECKGVFIAIGHEPNTAIFKGQIEMDERNYIVVRDFVKTNIPGIFAAGDVHDHRFRQAITAAAMGCMAAMEAEKYLSEKT